MRPPPAARAAHAHAPSLAPPRRATPQGHDSGTAPLPCYTCKGFRLTASRFTFTRDCPASRLSSPVCTPRRPRFEMQLFKLKLGTVDVEEADVEWVWRPYQNTASKRRAL